MKTSLGFGVLVILFAASFSVAQPMEEEEEMMQMLMNKGGVDAKTKSLVAHELTHIQQQRKALAEKKDFDKTSLSNKPTGLMEQEGIFVKRQSPEDSSEFARKLLEEEDQ